MVHKQFQLPRRAATVYVDPIVDIGTRDPLSILSGKII